MGIDRSQGRESLVPLLINPLIFKLLSQNAVFLYVLLDPGSLPSIRLSLEPCSVCTGRVGVYIMFPCQQRSV